MIKEKNKFCILLTATIDTKNCILTARTDPKTREEDYYVALEKWLKQTSFPIVFCENSMYPLSRISQLASKYLNRVEIIQFNGNDKAKELGKGYGEMKIIQKAMQLSNFIANSENIIKVSGRIFISNIDQIIKNFKDDSVVGYTIHSTNGIQNLMQTIIFIFKHEFFPYLEKYAEEINDTKNIIFEKAFDWALINIRTDGLKCIEINSPEYDGVSATTNINYSDTFLKN